MSDDQQLAPTTLSEDTVISAHVNLLQGIVTRLSNNSVSCKTWCLTLVSAVVGLAGAVHAPQIAVFTLVPIAIFFYMDVCYLAQEKAYRRLYNSVVLKFRARTYRLDDAYEASAPVNAGDFLGAVISWATFPVYGGLAICDIIALKTEWLSLLLATLKGP